MSGWQRTRARYRLVHEVAAECLRGGPEALSQRKAAIEAEYGDVEQFLRDVQRRYRMAVEARLDAVAESPDGEASARVAEALAAVAADHAGLLSILTARGDDPALAEGEARLRGLVRAFGGRSDAEPAPGARG
ncbi:hypothetical protein [Saccharopolyspora griseoalba]|uniref:Uncharacterized protein n=1 Tax=Saccharopolyspora griseoalba TaxID=1431848 RepID=A0ABW2LJT9_9PSEU